MKYKIKIKKYIDDLNLTWPERYARLESHHLEETKELIKHIEYLEEQEEKQFKWKNFVLKH